MFRKQWHLNWSELLISTNTLKRAPQRSQQTGVENDKPEKSLPKVRLMRWSYFSTLIRLQRRVFGDGRSNPRFSKSSSVRRPVRTSLLHISIDSKKRFPTCSSAFAKHASMPAYWVAEAVAARYRASNQDKKHASKIEFQSNNEACEPGRITSDNN